MKTDPFASIVECCCITRSAEESLSACGFAGGGEGPDGGGSDDSEPEELTQPELHPILILSLPDSQSQPEGNAESSSHDEDCTAAEVEAALPTSSDAGADAQNAVDLGRGKDSPVPMESETAQRVVSETDDASSDTEMENYRVEKRGTDSIGTEVLCSQPKVIRGPETPSRSSRLQGKAQNGQESAIKDTPPPSKKKKIDILNVLKEIAEHQGKGANEASGTRTKRYGLTFPRPRWWPEGYEDLV